LHLTLLGPECAAAGLVRDTWEQPALTDNYCSLGGELDPTQFASHRLPHPRFVVSFRMAPLETRACRVQTSSDRHSARQRGPSISEPGWGLRRAATNESIENHRLMLQPWAKLGADQGLPRLRPRCQKRQDFGSLPGELPCSSRHDPPSSPTAERVRLLRPLKRLSGSRGRGLQNPVAPQP